MKKPHFSILTICLFLSVTSCIHSPEKKPLSEDSTETTISLNLVSTDTPTPSKFNTSTPSPSLTEKPTNTLVPSLTRTPCAVFNFYSLQIGYPNNWKEEKENYFSNGDNYFEVKLLNLNTDPFNACEILAFQYSDRFGGPAKIFPFGNGCLLVPSYYSSSNYEDLHAAYVTSLESPVDNAGLIVLWTNILSFDNRVKIISSPPYTPDPRFISIIDESLPYISGETKHNDIFRELNYQEDIVRTRVDPISKGPETIQWQSSATNYVLYDEDQLETTNQHLSLFGYQLKLEKLSDWTIVYSLLKDDEIILTNIQWFWHMPVSINESMNNFVLSVSHQNIEDRTTCLIVSDEKIEEMDNNTYSGCWYSPFYIGDQLVTLNLENEPRLDLVIDGNTVQSYTINQYGPAFYPSPLWLSKFNEQWILELNNKVIINGEMLNLTLGYDEIFNWRILNGKPFYFYRDEGKVYISYDQQTLPISFDYVEHYYRSCCMTNAGQYNIYNTPNSVSFLAERDGYWYVVSLNSKGNLQN